ncbi:MAG: hypothetical protein Kow0098_29060 [Ignavibacteriaceae bacterium]
MQLFENHTDEENVKTREELIEECFESGLPIRGDEDTETLRLYLASSDEDDDLDDDEFEDEDEFEDDDFEDEPDEDEFIDEDFDFDEDDDDDLFDDDEEVPYN